MPGDVAELNLTIQGKDDASQALQAVAQAAEGLQAALQTMASSASSSGQNLTQISSSASQSASGLSSMAQGASDAASGLHEVGGGASEAAGGAHEAGSAAEGAGEGFNALGAGTKVAEQGLNSASQAANSFGVNVGPAAEAGHELTETVAALGEGLGTFAVAAGVATVALAGIGAAFVGEVLSATQEFGIELVHLSELSGMTEASLAGMEIRLTEVGLGAEDATRSIAFLARQMETLSVGDASAAQAELTSSIKASGTAAREVADAQAALAVAYQDTQGKILDATDAEVAALDRLAETHALTIAKIKADIQTLTDDYASAEQDRAQTLRDGLANRKQNEADSLQSLAFAHNESIQRINRQGQTARTAAARADAQFALKQENEKYAFAVSMQKKRDAEADAADKKRYADAEAKAKKAYDRQLAALQAKIDDENKKYDEQVATEQKRYDDQLKRLNESYAKQEAATAAHIKRTGEIEAGKAAGGSSQQSAFEIELRKILGFAGQTKEQTDTLFQSIADGEKSVGDILPLIADGFKNQAEEAEKTGAHINQAGEAMKIFGRSGYTMLPFLKEGGEAFKNDAALADEFGVAIDPEKVKEYTKAHADLMWALKGVEVQIGQALMPIMTRWLTELTTWVKTHRAEIVGFFEQLGTKVLQFARYIGDHKEDIIGFFKRFGEAAAQAKDIGEQLVKFFNDHWPEIQKAIELSWKQIEPYILLLEAGLAGIQAILDILNGDWAKAWKDMKNALGNEFKAIKSLYLDPLLLIPKAIVDAFGAVNWNSVWSAVWDPLKTLGKDAINKGFVDPINAVLAFLRNLKIHIPGVGIGPVHTPSQDISIPGLPGNLAHLAAGGIVTSPTLALIGESGPEAVIPLGRGGGAGGLVVNFHGNFSLSQRRALQRRAFAVATELRSRGMVVA